MITKNFRIGFTALLLAAMVSLFPLTALADGAGIVVETSLHDGSHSEVGGEFGVAVRVTSNDTDFIPVAATFRVEYDRSALEWLPPQALDMGRPLNSGDLGDGAIVERVVLAAGSNPMNSSPTPGCFVVRFRVLPGAQGPFDILLLHPGGSNVSLVAGDLKSSFEPRMISSATRHLGPLPGRGVYPADVYTERIAPRLRRWLPGRGVEIPATLDYTLGGKGEEDHLLEIDELVVIGSDDVTTPDVAVQLYTLNEVLRGNVLYLSPVRLDIDGISGRGNAPASAARVVVFPSEQSIEVADLVSRLEAIMAGLGPMEYLSAEALAEELNRLGVGGFIAKPFADGAKTAFHLVGESSD